MKMNELTSFFTDKGMKLTDGEGFCFGDTNREITKIAVCFTATLQAIECAVAEGCNLMVIHERMFFPTSYSGGLLEKHLSEKINYPRVCALIKHGITVFIANKSIEMPYQRKAFLEAAGISFDGKLVAVEEQLYTIPEVSLGELADRLMESLSIDEVLVTGHADRKVSTVAVLNGGEGITRQPQGMTKYTRQHPDVLICGETDEYPKWAAQELGIGMIALGHTNFDGIGLQMLASDLDEWNHGAVFIDEPRPWRVFA
ncbi:Nif3-like dinuclear metal center hexameric protein [Paenibacillus sp. BC26]|uniref:Nif3-like dinuclear metal center hexameric protein n=1 Tax=Paenibacillus sp. BC26 TaxID=1881032 RepID=UPI0008E5AA59|nr:Nif3-like dinuclear metal center hexameric protein [Paenibacillus sp. BC26]SFS73708.1 Putative GTP cyclohydrolase 1 type 2, NIF3 family [Paenibacillus sp. BC26]